MSLVPPLGSYTLNPAPDFCTPEVHAATANDNNMCLYVNDFLLSNT